MKNKLGKVGLLIGGLGAVIGGACFLLPFYLSWQPLTAPLPLEPGSVLRQTFHVRTSGRYFVEVDCKPVGPMKEMAAQFMKIEGGITPHVVCDISASILRSGIVLKSEDHKFLEPGGFVGSQKILIWDLLMADLPSAGSYELEINNRSGLKSWQPAEPVVEINLNEQNAADAAFFSGFGIVIGGAIFVIGLLLYVISFLIKVFFKPGNRHQKMDTGASAR